MRIDEIKKLIELVERSGIGELEVRSWWRSIRIAKTPQGEARLLPMVAPAPAAAPSASASAQPAAEAMADVAAEGLVVIASPMVGTFFRAASPTAEPYAKVGGQVAAGQAVCIVEAMKLMNEIESEVSGTVVKILVENGQPVEFNQPLFHIRPN